MIETIKSPLQEFRRQTALTQLALFTLFLLFVLALTSTFIPSLRAQIRNLFAGDYRSVVSTVHADLIGNGSDLTVVKVKTRDNLFLEIYDSVSDGSQHLISRIQMPDKTDGYFSFNGQATNLAIDDLNGDGHLEIIAPSFDQNLVGHLNIFRYNQDAKGLQRVL